MATNNFLETQLQSIKTSAIKLRIRNNYLLLLLVLLTLSCSKRRAFNEEDGQASVDIINFQTDGDAILHDVFSLVSNQWVIRGKNYSSSELEEINVEKICGASIDTSKVNSGGIIVINYNNAECGSIKRSGRITLTLQNYPQRKWKEKGATIKIDFLELVITYLASNKTMKLNGTAYVTNQSGGTWYELKYLNQASVVHVLTANDLILKFDDVKTAAFSLSKTYTFTQSAGIIMTQVNGNGVQGDITNVDTWGKTREGKNFTSETQVPVIYNGKCGAYKPTAGELKIRVEDKPFDLKATLSTDLNGEPVEASSTQCSNAWKLNWTYKRKTNKRVFNYN